MMMLYVADRAMSLVTLYGETIFTEVILYIYVVYRAVKRRFVFGACRIRYLVRVDIPTPQILVECEKTPL